MRRLRFTIEYDGMLFEGWQRQPGRRTVQGVLEDAWKTLCGHEVSVVAAGRTDSGVHARGQVAHVDTTSDRTIEVFEKAINSICPRDLIVRNVREVERTFHARHSARSRRYSYRISFVHHAIGRQYEWQLKPLGNIPAMHEAATHLLGEHDFTAFSKQTDDVEHYRCTIIKARWKEIPDGLMFDITANRFVRGMVRSLVGAMACVGRGVISETEFVRILQTCDRRHHLALAPPHGLTLEEVLY